MKSIERHLFAKNGKLAKWRRPVAYLLTLAIVIGIITLALVVVIPELGNTISMIVQQVPVAVKAVQKWLTDLPDSYPALAPAVAELNIDWSSLADAWPLQALRTGLTASWDRNPGTRLFSSSPRLSPS